MVGKVVVGALALFGLAKVANADIEFTNYSTQSGISKQIVGVYNNALDVPYTAPTGSSALILYAKDTNDNKLKVKGINPLKTEKTKLYLEEKNVTAGTPNQIKVKFLDNTGYENRNVILKQDTATDYSVDPNTYDLWDITNGGTTTAYINLPSITNPVDGKVYATWDTISTNCADINFDGKVDMRDFAKFAPYWKTSGHSGADNWANFADITQDGTVDEQDLAYIAGNWLAE